MEKEDKEFSIYNFRDYLAKIQSIGINRNSITNKDYILFKDLLIFETAKNNKKISEYFSILLSNENIKNESINLFAMAYANYNSIFQNYYQYNEQNVKLCITIGDTYFNDYVEKCNIKGIENMIEEIKMWLQEIIGMIYNQW